MDLTLQHKTINQDSASITVLISRAKEGDRLAQSQIYRTYHAKWLGLSLRYCNNRDDALAVLNQAFLKIFKNLHVYKVNSSFDGWGYRIVQNEAIDYARKELRRFKKVNLTEIEQEVYVDSNALVKLESKDLLKLLQNLPSATRTVFNLFAIDGFKHKEIAAKLAISEGTSKWHVSSARKQLKPLIMDLLK